MATLQEIIDEMSVLHEQAKTIRAKAESENRDLTEDEAVDLNDALDRWDAYNAQAETVKRMDKQEEVLKASVGRVTSPSDVEEVDSPRNLSRSDRPKMPATVATDRGTYGFQSIGHWATACQQSWTNPQATDPRLTARMTAATTYGSEGVGADGGFTVPPDFRDAIITQIEAEEGLLGRTNQMSTSSNSITVPVDESAPWTTSGLFAEWEGDGDVASSKKGAFKQRTIRANKLMVLCKITEELLSDSSAMDSYLRNVVPQRMAFEINDKLISGTGAGQPFGVLNSSATVEVAKEGSQTADTINYLNILKMWSRCYAPSRSKSVWIANQDVEPQLLSLSFDYGAGTSNEMPIYMPGHNLAGSPFSTLLGRPIIFSQAMSTLGDKGDIMLVDWSQYMTVVKGGLRSDVSIHLHFDQDVTTYKFVLRCGGAPSWSSTLAAKNGSGTYSPYVTLAERA